MEMLRIGKLDVSLVTKHLKQGMSQTACLDDVHNHVLCTSSLSADESLSHLCLQTNFTSRVICLLRTAKKAVPEKDNYMALY